MAVLSTGIDPSGVKAGVAAIKREVEGLGQAFRQSGADTNRTLDEQIERIRRLQEALERQRAVRAIEQQRQAL